jgi:Periplasmic protein TonB, links inner and outer membranes
MSEKVLAFLLHLYPLRYRAKYFQESMLLYRDRFEFETGLYRKARLWYDLFADLVISLPKAWRTPSSVLAVHSEASLVTVHPAFNLLHKEPIRPTVILFGGVVSLGLILTFICILNAVFLHQIHPDKMSPIEAVMHNISKQETPKDLNNVYVDAKIAAGLLIYKEEPACQKGSDGVKVTGTVVLAITIDRSGKVSHTQVLSGPKLLRSLAIATARKYRYKPYLLNNTPVEVDTAVSIPIDCFFHTGQA